MAVFLYKTKKNIDSEIKSIKALFFKMFIVLSILTSIGIFLYFVSSGIDGKKTNNEVGIMDSIISIQNTDKKILEKREIPIS